MCRSRTLHFAVANHVLICDTASIGSITITILMNVIAVMFAFFSIVMFLIMVVVHMTTISISILINFHFLCV